ncbi:MAG: secretin N-terminal domain-containing protein [Verrucomicrobiota bacterium]
MKKLTFACAACLGAVAFSLVAQTPPAPGTPAATTNTVRPLPSRVAPSTQTPPAVPTVPTLPATPAPATPVQAVPATPAAPAPLPGVPGAQVAPGGAAPAGRGGEAMIPIEELRFANMELGQFLDIYAEQVGKTLIYGPALGNMLKATVTLKAQTALTKTELIQLMESVMAQNGIVVQPLNDKSMTVVPEAMAFQQGGRFKPEDAMIPESQSFETRIINLTNALPSEVATVLKDFSKVPNGIISIDGTRKLILRDYAVNIKRMVEIIEQIDVNIPMEVELELIPIKYALSADMASVLGSLTSGGPVSTGTTGSRTGSTTSRNRTGTTGNSGRLGVGGTTGGVQGLQNQARPGTPTINAPGAQSTFQDQLRQITARAAAGGNVPILGDAKIIPDERTNALLVFGTKEERDMIKKIIKELDVVQQQVLIEAIIMEVSLSDDFNFGVAGANATSFDKGSKRIFGGSKFTDFGSLTNFPTGLADGFSYFGQLGSWDLAVTAVAGDASVNVLSRPRIQTSHAVQASIFVGQTVPFITGSTTDINGGARSSFDNNQVGITLDVLPLINQDGLVVLDIVQSVAQLGEDRIIDGNAVPTTTERNANARVAVQNGETVILGGFISSNKRKTKTGVPYLKDIPLLGALFSQRVDANQRVELIVLIRPTVLKTPEIASSVAEHERQRLSGVRRAEAEILAEEGKLAEKSEKEMEKMRKSKKPVSKEEMLTPSSPLLQPADTTEPKPAVPQK